MKTTKKTVPGGHIYVFESSTGQLSSQFVAAKHTRHKSQADMIMELIRENGGMTPDAVAKSLSIDLDRARQLMSRLKKHGYLKKVGIAYELV